MAKILLNVELVTGDAQKQIDAIKTAFDGLAKSMGQMTPNKDLTSQLNALAKAYGALTKASNAQLNADIERQKLEKQLAKLEVDTAKAEAQRAKETSNVAIAAEKAAQAIEKTRAETEKANAEAAKAKTAQEKLAQAQEKTNQEAAKTLTIEKELFGEQEEQTQALWQLEDRYGKLVNKIKDVAEQYSAAAPELAKFENEAKAAYDELYAFNRGEGDLSQSAGELTETLHRLTAEMDAQVVKHKDNTAEIKSAQKGMEEWEKSLAAAETTANKTADTLNRLLLQITNIENRYPAGTFDKLKSDIAAQKAALENLGEKNDDYIKKSAEVAENTRQISSEFTKLKAETDHAAPAVATLGEKFGNLITRYAKFYASSLLVRKPLEEIVQALGDVNETLTKTEDKVIEIRRILENPDSADSIADRMYDLAYQYGQTFDNVSDIVANFARTGRDFNDSIKATEAALLAMNVAELNATQASEGLISILAQFKKEPEDLLNVVDELNKAADKNPVTTGKLLTALQRTGSSAHNANLTLERTVGIITSLSEATNRSGQNLGTAVNSLIQYSTKAESLDLFARLSEDAANAVEAFRTGTGDILDVWSAVSDEINRLQDESVEKQNELFEMFNSQEVEELSSSLHDELGDIFEQIGDVYDIANTYRKNYFIALLANMDRVFKVEQEISDAEGYSAKENAQYMDTYTAKVNQLNAAWQKLANDEQGTLKFRKFLVDVGIDLTELIEDSGGIATEITRIVSIGGGLMVTLNASKLAQSWSNFTASIQATSSAMMGLSTAANATQAAFGWIGVAVIAVGALTAELVEYNRKQKEQREEALAVWKETKEEVDQLDALYDILKDLTPGTDEYREIEEQINDALGDRKILLRDVTEDTDEYTAAVGRLVENLRTLNISQAYSARDAAEKDYIAKAQEAEKSAAVAGRGDLGAIGEAVYGFGASLGAKATIQTVGDAYQELLTLAKMVREAEDNLFKAEQSGNKDRITAAAEYNNKLHDIYDGLKAAWDEYGVIVNETDAIIKGFSDSVEQAKEKTEEAARETAETARTVLTATSESYRENAEKAAEFEKTLETVSKAQKEYNENGAVSVSTMDALLALGPDYVSALFDEHHALDLNSSSVAALNAERAAWLEAYGYIVPGVEAETNAIDTNTDAYRELIDSVNVYKSDLEKEIEATQNRVEIGKKFKDAIEKVNAAQKELNDTGKLSEETRLSLLTLDKQLVRAMLDENGEIDLSNEKLARLITKWTDYVTELGFVIEKTEDVKEETAEAVDAMEDLLALRKSELTILEKSDAGLEERVGKIRQIVHWIEEEIVELKQTGANQIEINKLEAERLDYLNKITSLYEDQEKARQKAIEEQEKLLEQQRKAAEQAAKEAEEAEKARIKAIEDAIKANISAYDSNVAYLTSELNLVKAQDGSIAEQEEWYRKINAKLEEKINYLSTLGGYETEINNLKREQLENEQKIAKLYEDEAEARKKEEEERKKDEEQAFKDRLSGYDDEIARLKSVLALAKEQGASVSEQAEIERLVLEQIRLKIEAYEETGEHETEINKLKLEELELEKTIEELLEKEVTDLRDKKIKEFSDEIALLQSRLKLAQGTYGAEAEQLSILADINQLYAEQIEYLISIEASELEINKVKAAQLQIQSQILSLQREALALQNSATIGAMQNTLDALLAGIEVEEESLELTEEQVDLEAERTKELEKDAQLEEEIAKAKLEYIESVIDAYLKGETSQATLEEKQAAVTEAREKLALARREAAAKAIEAAFAAQKESEQDALDLEEKRLAVEKARIALASAENDLTTRVYNEATGQWERTANAKNVASAQSAFDKAVKSLNDYVEEQAWTEVAEAVRNGSVEEEELNEILTRWEAEHYGEDTPEFIARIREAYKDALGGVDESDSVVGAEKAVENAVNALNDYLKQQAVAELKAYLEAGNRDAAGMQAILDKWLGMGEGTQLYEWRDGLLDVVTEAIESNYYDDSKIRTSLTEVSSAVNKTTSAVNKTTSSVQKFEKTFISEITKASKVSADAVREVIEKYQDKVDQRYLDWAEDVYNQVAEIEGFKAYTSDIVRNGLTQQEIDKKISEMKANSAAWNAADDDFKKSLENQNLVLGTQLGWKRDNATGIWYDENGNRAYDGGGVLEGIGGIKATRKPEVILDPDLTEKILRPNSEAQFRAFADALGLIFERGDRLAASSKPIFNAQRYSDSHNTSTVINGVPIPAAAAEQYTVAQLARAMSIV